MGLEVAEMTRDDLMVADRHVVDRMVGEDIPWVCQSRLEQREGIKCWQRGGHR